jgi:hypothetical protein
MRSLSAFTLTAIFLVGGVFTAWGVGFLAHAGNQWDIATDTEDKIVELQNIPSAADARQSLIVEDRQVRASEWDVIWFIR